jgi:hypothetical protein
VADAGDAEEETVTIPETGASVAEAPKTTSQLDRRNIVFALFIGIGLYTLIQAVPYVIVHLTLCHRASV